MNSSGIDMSFHSETFPWFQAKQIFLLLLNAVCLGERQQIPISWPLVLTDQASAPQNLRIYLSLRIFSNKEILKFDWLRTQIWAKKVCSAKKKFVVPGPGIKPTVYHIQDEYANHYTTDAVGMFIYNNLQSSKTSMLIFEFFYIF